MYPLAFIITIIIVITTAATASETSFQIKSLEQPDLCIEVFKTLDQVGRLWIRRCKANGERGIERQMFAITNDGKLYPHTKPNYCFFLYSNKNLKYRKDCDGILHNKKNQFAFNIFDGTMFLMGDLTKVMTVRELEERKEIKLQKGSSSKISKQQWNLHFERDRVLQPRPCNPTPPPMSSSKYPPSPKSTNTPTKPPTMPSDKYPTYPSSTLTPTKALPARWYANHPTSYQTIRNKRDLDFYMVIWLINNLEDERASDIEQEFYHEQLEKYG